MKPGLQFRLNQQLTLTPQLQQAIRLLQLSQLELEAELRQIAESNPLLEFSEDAANEGDGEGDGEAASFDAPAEAATSANDGDSGDEPADWSESGGSAEEPIDFSSAGGSRSSGGDEDHFEPQNAAPETLQEHLLWQLNLTHLSLRERTIAAIIIDALNADGYLGETLESVTAAVPADLKATVEEVDAVRRQVQRFDPTGVASLDLRDCLRVQLEQFDPDLPQREVQHVHGQLVDQAGALGDRDELRRRDAAPLRVVPPHQRLDADELAHVQADLRLVVQHQVIGPLDSLMP